MVETATVTSDNESSRDAIFGLSSYTYDQWMRSVGIPVHRGFFIPDLKLVERDVVVVDGIDVGDLDYLDIGLPMGISEVVPVTVKSLVFPNSGGL